VVRLMLNGSHTDPASVSVDRIRRVHQTVPGALILLRCWDVDDRRGVAHQKMAADPLGFARRQVDWWLAVVDGLDDVPLEQLMAGLNNEVNVDQYGAQLFSYTMAAMDYASRNGLRLGVGMFSVGTPGKPGESQYDMTYYSAWEDAIVAGDHVLVLHEYMQPEGMYAVWTDEQGDERRDWQNLINRHVHWPMKRAKKIIGEWGVEGLLFNRHRHPEYGHNGWQSFPEWPATRIADEYVTCCQVADPSVLAICQFIADAPDRTWHSFDVLPAYDALLARKHLCEVEVDAADTPTEVYIPVVNAPAVNQPEPQEAKPMNGTLDPNVMMAILDVESGAAFGEGGRLVIRFEAHVFRDRLRNDGLFSTCFRVADKRPWEAPQYARVNESAPWWPIHTGRQSDEWTAFELASRLNRRAAAESISMGRPQLMGFNHARVGYPTAEAMFQAFGRRQDGEAAQIVAFVNYMLDNPALMRAVRERDWRAIAAAYNGAGSVDRYSGLLEAAWRKRTAA